MAKLPMHLRWELSPVPHEKGKSQYGGSYLEEYDWWTKKREKSLINEAIYMGKEIFFLKGVFENNKKLWYFTCPYFRYANIYRIGHEQNCKGLGPKTFSYSIPTSVDKKAYYISERGYK